VTIDAADPFSGAAAAFSPDGSRFATGDNSGAVVIWDAVSGARLTTLLGHAAGVTEVAFSADGSKAASASLDGSVRIWDLDDRDSLLELRADLGNPYGVRFNPDGSLVITGGDDGAAHVWDATSGAPMARIRSDPLDVVAAAFAADGRHIVMANRRAGVTTHRCEMCGSTDEVLALARSRVTRDLTPAERLTFLHEDSPGATAEPDVTAVDPRHVGIPVVPSVEPGDICAVLAGPCEIAAGTHRPGLFDIPVTFSLTEPVRALGQAPAAVALEVAGGEITMLSGRRTLGYEGDSTVLIGTQGADFIDYLDSKSWLDVGAPVNATVGGRVALIADVAVATDIDEPLDIFFAEPFPFASFPGEVSRVVTVDTGDTYLVIQASISGGPSEDFLAAFDAFVRTVRFPPG
jgi:dipeptidyl aminopeptidase/acylaminoacyl peptidase